MSVIFHSGGFCMLALALAVHAEERMLGPKELAAELVQNNPDIRAARHRWEAATKRPSQVGALPDPAASITNFGVGHPFSQLNQSNFAYLGFGVSQQLPFPGKLALASEEAQREAESEQQKYRAVVLGVTSRLKFAYYEWVAVQKALELTARNRDLLSRFEQIARTRYSVGKGLQQDVLKAQLELSGFEREIEMLNEKEQRTKAEIAMLLATHDVRLAAPSDFAATPLTLSVEELLKGAEESPLVRAEQKLVDARAVGVDRSKKDFRPDFSVNFQWQHTGSQFPDYYMATAEVKIPIYYARKQRYALEESRSRLQEAKENFEGARQQTIYGVKEQYFAIQSSERILKLYKTTLIPQATLTMDSATAAYEVASIDFLSLLNNLTTLIALERQYYEEVARHEEAIARLEPVAGKELVPFGEGMK